MDIKDHACKGHEGTPEDLGEGGEVFLFSIPAGEQRCLVSGLREWQFLLIYGVGGVGGKRLQSHHLLLSPQGFLRLGSGTTAFPEEVS